MYEKYRDFFDIDPEYFPQVNAAVIESRPDIWKKFYPHETFVKLLNDTISVLTRKQKVSLWVEGAYGTGKSHAVLTLKKLLDASEEDTKEYFDRYKDLLGDDLFKKFQQAKSGEKKVLTVHRYGSANIPNDERLVVNIQESIVQALREAGYDNYAQATLKEAAIKWLSQDWAKQAMDNLMQNEYKNLFSGDNVDILLQKLMTYDGQALQDLMAKIVKVGNEKSFAALKLDVKDLVDWIKEIIKSNNLKAIVFIWDEFSEYFKSNMRKLTGFQEIVDISGTDPFYLLIVTHDVNHLFAPEDKEWRKVLGRFLSPICTIELPENMAFKLMAKAMEKKSDPVTLTEWNDTVEDLDYRTKESRKLVAKHAGIEGNELSKILPIHPYAALLLKYISTAFDSNQRSMFDFIKNDRGDEIKGFQWFIDNYGRFNDNPLLTVDMLWEFFYEKGKEFLNHEIRVILDAYNMFKDAGLYDDQQRVLKTVLLLQAISVNTGNAVPLFIPNKKNLNSAFEGTDLDDDAADRIANTLVPNILYQKKINANEWQYCVLVNTGDIAEIEAEKKKAMAITTSSMIITAKIPEQFKLPGFLSQRFRMHFTSLEEFDKTISRVTSEQSKLLNSFSVILTLAKNDGESILIERKIDEAIKAGNNFIYIDASQNNIDKATLEEYADATANAIVSSKGQNKTQAKQYQENAYLALQKWYTGILAGNFIVHTPDGKSETLIGDKKVFEYLVDYDKSVFPEGLEHQGNVSASMWEATNLGLGAACGIAQKTKSVYANSNKNLKLENYIGDGIWATQEYWNVKPNAYVSKLKVYIDTVINEAFTSKGRIGMSNILESLIASPYGFMPCNLTAFILGFILKEYAGSNYTWSDGNTNDKLDEEKLKETIANALKHLLNPSPKHKENFIIAMTNEEKSFNNATAKIFDIDEKLCTSIENTISRIRICMKALDFPIWTLKYVLKDIPIMTSEEEIEKVVKGYMDLANNTTGSKTDSDIAMELGRLFLQYPSLIQDMSSIVTKDYCTKGMKAYLSDYRGGELVKLAYKIGDNGQFLHAVKSKFDADAATWVWKQETADSKIDEVITEYRIVDISNNYLPKTITYNSALAEWKNRCSRIAISYDYAKSDFGELSSFIGLLYSLKKIGQLSNNQKNQFLEQLELFADEFETFYLNQIELFKEIFKIKLSGQDESIIVALFKAIPTDAFTMERQAYQAKVESLLSEKIAMSGITRIKSLWLEKTATVSPSAWSTKNGMSVLFMVPEKEITIAKRAFGILNSRNTNGIDQDILNKATKYLENATFYDDLNDIDKIDAVFRKRLLKNYSEILTDLDEVKDTLKKNLANIKAYDYYGEPLVLEEIKALAEYKYKGGGYLKAEDAINRLSVDEAKLYLLKLVRDNPVVGIEIIINNRGK